MRTDLKGIFSTRTKKTIHDNSRIMSAVLVPVFCKDNEYNILFTKRSFDVPHHRGQISFPGGAYSEEDASLLETALRESWEEIGLSPRDVEVVGELDDALTATSNYIIKPYVALIPYPYNFTVNESEITEIFDVPISHLNNKLNFKKETRVDEEGYTWYYVYKYKGRIIWGATAYILKQFLDTLKSNCGVQG